MADLKTNLLGFVMNSPVIGASGTVGYGVEYEELADFAKIGGISARGLPCTASTATRASACGRPPPASSTASACRTPACSTLLTWSCPRCWS